LKVSNAHESSSFALKSITSTSSGWVVEPLSAFETATQDASVIGPQQTTNLFFRITPANEKATKDTRTNLYHSSHLLSSSNEPTIEDITHYSLMKREKNFLAEKKKQQKDLTAEPLDINHDIYLDVYIIWETSIDSNLLNSQLNASQATKMKIIGQQNICFIPFLTPTTVDQAISETDESSLRFTIESPRKVLHDFSQQKYVKVVTSGLEC
jgi:hypothetical protein